MGSHLTKKFVSMKADVRALVRYNCRGDHEMLAFMPAEMKHKADVIMGDLRDSETILDTMRNNDIERYETDMYNPQRVVEIES